MSQLTKNFSNSGPGGFIQTITGDAGVPVVPAAGNVNVFGQGTVTPTTIANSGIVFTGAGNTLSATFKYINLPATSAGNGILYINNNIFLSQPFSVSNTFIGQQSGTQTVTGGQNTIVGYQNALAITSGQNNQIFGFGNTSNLSSGNNNIVYGYGNAQNLTTGINNMVFGISNMNSLITGSYNLALGFNAGFALAGAESSNIYINNNGVAAENNVMRIGTTGAGIHQINKTFIAGIDGVNVGSVTKVLTMASEQIGTATITAGTGISVTPGANTITIAATGTTTLTYTAVSTTPYIVLTTDDFLGVNSSGGAITIQLPNAPSTGRVWTIKDSTGSAATHNITITTVGGVVNIDGATSFVMNTAYESINVLFDGSTYQIY